MKFVNSRGAVHNYVLPVVLFFFVVGLFATLTLTLRELKRDFDERDQSSRAQDLRKRLELRFESAVSASTIMRDRLVHAQGFAIEDFIEESEALRKHFGYFQAINFVSPTGTIEWVTPIEGNEEALGRNLSRHPVVGAIVNDPESRYRIMLSPPLRLLQGGEGIVFYIPLHSDGDFYGWLNLVFRMQPFIERLFFDEEWSRYHVKIRDEESDVILFSNFPPEMKHTSSHQFRFYGRPWVIDIHQQRYPLFDVFLIFTSLLVVLLSFFLMAALKRYLDYWDGLELKLDEALSETMLLRALSHDLNTPLTVSNLLIDRLDNIGSEQVKRICHQLRDNNERQEGMLKGVREFQLMRTSKKLDSFHPVDIAKCLRNAMRRMEEVVHAKGIECTLLDELKDEQVLGKEVCFEEHIFTNLITNAVKYCPLEGGKIEVKVARVEEEIHISISDNGPGLPEDVLTRLRMKLHSISQKGTGSEVGSGFGLLLVKNFVELFSGDLSFESSSAGTVAHIKFPLA
jgi:signal transduction histidine kinase